MDHEVDRNEDLDSSTDQKGDLRRRAEEVALERSSESRNRLENLSPEAARRALHELWVHQIELEMQNEELRRTQELLDASRARYFDLYDLAPIGYCTVNRAGVVEEANLTAANLLGVPRGALVNVPLTRFILNEEQDTYYFQFKKAFETGDPQESELRMRKADRTPFWAHLATCATTNHDGEPMCRVVIGDISARKHAEEEKTKIERQLQQARKLESIGQLAGGVAHDFNNMLAVILGYVEIAIEQVDADEPLRSDLLEIRKAALRSADVTRQLLAFACKQPVIPKVLDLNEVVAGMVGMLRKLIGENIEIEWRPGVSVWPVEADQSQIEQAVANLCINVRDAVTDVGKILLETGNSVLDEAFCASRKSCVPGEYVWLAVRDNGCGMNADTLAHLFEPFFTTKEIGKGTGLGLATVYGAIKQNHGFVDVRSKQGEGTTFTLYLPRYVGDVQLAPPKASPKAIRPGAETILLVEDEPSVRRLAAKMLERQGYTVMLAATPDEAIRLVRERTGEINLLLTDVAMAGMNGWDLAQALRRICPSIKRLFMSGYTDDAISQHVATDEQLNFIHKPFSSRELIVKVRQALDGR